MTSASRASPSTPAKPLQFIPEGVHVVGGIQEFLDVASAERILRVATAFYGPLRGIQPDGGRVFSSRICSLR